MRLRRSDFSFPLGHRRQCWRDLRWALRLLTGESPSWYPPGSLFWQDEHEAAMAHLYYCARRGTARSHSALQARLPAAVWTILAHQLAVWPSHARRTETGA